MYCLIALERESWTDFRKGIWGGVVRAYLRWGWVEWEGKGTSSMLDLEGVCQLGTGMQVGGAYEVIFSPGGGDGMGIS